VTLDAHTPSALFEDEDDDEDVYERALLALNCLIFGKDAAYRHLRCPD